MAAQVAPPRPWREIAAEVAALVREPSGSDRLTLRGALGRVLADPALAVWPLPRAAHAVMDGYALGSTPPGRYKLRPGRAETLASDEACAIAAGETAPLGAAAVVLAERAAVEGGLVVVPGEMRQSNIRRAGEEAAAGDVILKAGTRLEARHVALAAAAGVADLTVWKTPRIALAGVQEGSAPLPHLTVTASLLESQALRLHVDGVEGGERLTARLARLTADHDAVVVVAESLNAEEGRLCRAIAALGGEPVVHRAALKPAKPVIVGRIGGCAVVGLAGTAYAVTVAAHLFLRPALLRLCGRHLDDPLLPAAAAFSRSRAPGRGEAVPALLRRGGEGLTLTEAGRFGQLSALAAMDGFALIEADVGDLTPGAPLAFHPLLTPLV